MVKQGNLVKEDREEPKKIYLLIVVGIVVYLLFTFFFSVDYESINIKYFNSNWDFNLFFSSEKNSILFILSIVALGVGIIIFIWGTKSLVQAGTGLMVGDIVLDEMSRELDNKQIKHLEVKDGRERRK